MAAALSYSNVHTYQGLSEINFSKDDNNRLSVTIDTLRLHIRTVEATESEYENYAALFGDEVVMSKFGSGNTRTKENLIGRIQGWVARWQTLDPYAGLSVFDKDTKEFLGHIVLGHSVAPGESELAYIFHQEYWGKGYGKEAVRAIVEEYAPATVQEGYTLDGKPLQKIVATTRTDNIASVSILERLGMHLDKEEEKFGAKRHHYSIELNEIQKKSSEKTKSLVSNILEG